jgi:hypothetical protein
MTRGLDCQNPMNVMTTPAFTWDGEIKPTLDPKGFLCTFDTIENGIRAGAINLLSYYLQDGCDTIQTIITRYAPGNSNPTASYILFVANHCGVDPAAKVDLTNPAFLKNLCYAISCFEQGCDCVTDAQLTSGVYLALAHRTPPALTA